MRLDFFLKASRLVKRRAIAREMCDTGRVLVNGHEAKPAKDVKQGDIITLKFSSRVVELDVLKSAAFSKNTTAAEFYKIKSETRTPEEKHL